MEREIERAHRTNATLVLAFVDVDGLKRVNDTAGHAAGDRLLRRTAELMATHLRPYDLVVRVGGDEFVCSLHGIPMDGVTERFELVSADLRSTPEAGSISVGLADLRPRESLDDLLLRADVQLLATKGKGSRRSRFTRRPLEAVSAPQPRSEDPCE